MPTDTNVRQSPPIPPQRRPDRVPSESVDLDDPAAVHRAIAQHQAGKAVFAVPFNSTAAGTLTWLTPRAKEDGPAG
jgi:hypothetical protein